MRSIKTKIVLSTTSIVLAAVAFLGVLGYRQLVDALTEVQRERLELVARTAARDLDGKLEKLAAQHLSPGQTYLSPVTVTPEPGGAVIHIATTDTDKEKGTLAAFPLSSLTANLSALSVGETGFAALIARDGTVLAHPDPARVLRPIRPTTPEERRVSGELRTLRSGFARTALLGADSLVAYAPLPRAGWEIAVVLPTRELMVHPEHFRNVFLAACGVILTAVIALCFLFARKLTGSVHQIIRHTRQVAAGDFPPALKISSGDELELLARSFNAMTERLQRATQARESLHNIVQSILDPLVIAGGDGCIKAVNPSAVTFLGHPEESLTGMPLASLFPEGEAIFHGAGFQKVLESGPIRNYETQIVSREGQRVPVLFSCSLTPPEGEGGSGMVGLFKDITALRGAELARIRALREAEEARDKIDAILKSVSDALVVTDIEGRIILMNLAAEELLGTPLVEAWQQPIAAVIGEKNLRDHLLAQMKGAASSPVDLEIFDHRRHEMRVFQTRTSPVGGYERVTSGLITILRDATHERQVDRLKNEFISTAAHELRTPLTSIMGYSEFLLYPEEFGGFNQEQQREFLAEIFEKAELLSRIVNELLDISRIESGQAMPLDRTRCRIGETIARAVRTFRLHCPEHRFEIAIADPAAEIWVDEGKFAQVLENLLSNAVKYSPGGGFVRVSGEFVDDHLYVSVEDRGIGMTEEQTARIFDKFYRADSSNTAIGGLGLGMSIVRSIIVAHGGTIGVDSTPGAGTTVSFTLPVGSDIPFCEDDDPNPLRISMSL